MKEFGPGGVVFAEAVNMTLPDNPDELIPTRDSLLSRLKDWEDGESWREFFHTYWKLIYATARRAGLNDAEAQEVVQETIIEVCRHMPGFRYDRTRGSFKSWLLRMTHWRIKNLVRRRQREAARTVSFQDTRAETEAVESVPDSAPHDLVEIWEQEWERNLFDAALQRIKVKVNPKHYQIFDLVVLKRRPIKRVCDLLQVNAAQVYLVRHRLTALVKKEVKAVEKKFAPEP